MTGRVSRPATRAMPCANYLISCCGPKGICGYGPDFCGTGCTSNCDATARCGEYSEDANMQCGMKLCCSATGWCGSKSYRIEPCRIRSDYPQSNRGLLQQRGSFAWNFALPGRIRLVCHHGQTFLCQRKRKLKGANHRILSILEREDPPVQQCGAKGP